MGVALSKCLGWWQDLVGEELLPEPAESIDPSSSSSSSSSMSPTNYDVFLSFSGTDTRLNFTSHLYRALDQAGFQTFMDEEELKIGEEIAPNLLKAIHESRISIPIFSINYASSKWCLNELVKIMESRENNGQKVLPIFFDVEPGDVRKQTNAFGKKFHQLANSFKDKGKVESWKKALTEAGNLKGEVLKSSENRNEAKLIQRVVKCVWDELRKTLSDVPENLVGIDSVVEELLDLLNIGCPDVKIIGIWGMGGIGKTTIAKTIFRKIRDKFEGNVILEDIREASRQKSLVFLQSQLLSTILKQDVQSINSVEEGMLCIKNRLHAKKVLIFLDDVDKEEQLEALVGKPDLFGKGVGAPDLFGKGSRIIITTRDKHLLEVHPVDGIYEAKELDDLPSLKLFSRHAFRKDQPPNDFLELAKEVVGTAEGLPLALRVLGSYLVDKRSPVLWRSTLDKLKIIPDKRIQEKLKISYDGLDLRDQEIFLSIACFFIGMGKEYVIDIIDGCGFQTEVGIFNLNQRSLLKIDEYNKLRMHDQLRDMGRYIINQESPDEPGERSRLCSRVEVLNVLERRKGTRKVKGLQLQGFHNMIDLRTEAISDMSELRLLQIDGANLVGDFNNLPSELRWLSWEGCPMKSIPSDFPLGELAVLDLSYSKIEQVWNGWHQNKLEKLKVLKLSWCELLTKTPDFSRLPNLEKLYLKGCIRLTELPCSVCDLKYLKKLILSHCSNLNRLPDFLGNLTELEVLELDGCKLLCSLPDSIGKMGNLKTLLLDRTSITELPDAVGFLENIESLSANLCKELVKLPDSMGRMSLLRRFSMFGTGIVELPEDFGKLSSLTELNLQWCRQLRELPCVVCDLKSLKILALSGCSNLNRLPDLLGNLTELEVLELDECKLLCRLPDSIGKMRNLKTLLLDWTSITELPDAVGFLINIENLSAKLCKDLVKLPDSMGRMSLLRRFPIYGTGIVKLPEDFGMLSSLTELNLEGCKQLRELPCSVCDLKSLKILKLSGCSNLNRLPDSLGNLTELEVLELDECKLLCRLPDSIGKMGNLKTLLLDRASITELPDAVGFLENIENLSANHCKELVKLPDSMGRMSLLRRFSMDGTGIVKLPEDFGMLSSLTELYLQWCRQLRELPCGTCNLKSLKILKLSGCSNLNNAEELLGSLKQLEVIELENCKLPSRSTGWICNLRNLKSLELDGTSITELHNVVGLLKNVEKLSVRDCKNLVKLPDSMVGMRRLRELRISGSSIVKLPEDFGMLSSLESLLICDCREFRGFPENLGSLTRLEILYLEGNSKMGMLPNSLSGLCSLKYLRANRCKLSEGGIPSDIGKLSSLSELDLSYNNFSSLPEMPTTLEEIDVKNCISLKSLPDLSDLKHLSGLNLTNCKKLAEIQGIENVKKLWVSGCSRALVNSVKKSFGQGGLLSQLEYFSFDGSKIPDCFIPLEISSPRTKSDRLKWEIGLTSLWIPEQHQNLIAWVLCFVLTKTPEKAEIDLCCDIIDKNGQKLSSAFWKFISISPSKRHQDHILKWDCGISFSEFRSQVKQGFQLSFTILADSCHEMELVVKEGGVHLVYEETAESTYKGIANAISLSLDDDVGGEASSSTRKRKMSQLLYQDGKDADGAEASSSSTRKRTKLQLMHHDDDDDDHE